MAITVSDLNSYIQTYSGAALRGFDKTIAVTVTAYIRVWGFDNTFGGAMSIQNGPTGSATYFHRFEYVNAANSLFNGYYDGSGVFVGNIIYPQDLVDSIEISVRRAVDLVEGQISNRSISALICHASCHGSCHTSRGRR
jgi:hypothetical protein